MFVVFMQPEGPETVHDSNSLGSTLLPRWDSSISDVRVNCSAKSLVNI